MCWIVATGRGLRLPGDEFDLVAVRVGQVGGVVSRAAGVGMLVGEEHAPAVLFGLLNEGVEAGAATRVEREVVQAGAGPVVAGGGHGGRLLDDEVGAAEPPAAAIWPVLELLVAEPGEQPPPLRR